MSDKGFRITEIMVAVITAAVGSTAFNFQTFQTLDRSKEDKAYFDKRLDKIESKLDKALELK